MNELAIRNTVRELVAGCTAEIVIVRVVPSTSWFVVGVMAKALLRVHVPAIV